MSRLIPCPACFRHVLSTERGCPFCRADLPGNASPPAPLPRTRLGRAAMFAAGATLVGVAACKNGTASKDAGTDRDAMSDASGGAGGGSAGKGGGTAGAAGTAGPGGAGAGGTGGAGGGRAGAPGTGGGPGSGGAVMDGGPALDGGGGGRGGGVLYGAPPIDARSEDTSPPLDATQDRGVVALYGAAPPFGLPATPER